MIFKYFQALSDFPVPENELTPILLRLVNIVRNYTEKGYVNDSYFNISCLQSLGDNYHLCF